MIYSIKKFFAALKDSLSSSQQTTPKLIMTLLVKDEEMLLERNILFHKEMGVDAFIITDNNSTDSTPQIIQKYIDLGWVIESIKEPGTDYNQKVWVDRMIWSAKCRHNATWVINADADEFWSSPSGDLKAEMMGRENILKCRVVSVLPEDGVDFWRWDKVIRPMADTTLYDLSPYNIYRRYTYKVAHAANGYLRISMGNHKVKMLSNRVKESEITIYHYNILGREPFIKKMVNGGKQIEQNPKKSVARHWRYLYGLYKSGLLDAEYDRMIGTKYFEEFQQLGYIYRDNTIPEIFKKINKG